MSNVANRRVFLEAAQALAKTNAPSEGQIMAVFHSLSALMTDLAGEQVTVVMYSPELDRRAAKEPGDE